MNRGWLQKQYCGAIVFSLFVFAANAQTLEILPANPKAYEPVTLRFTPYGGLVGGPWRVRMNANRITVYFEPVPAPLLPPGGFPAKALLGQLPAGNYEVEVVLKGNYAQATFESSQGVKQFVVADGTSKEMGMASFNTLTDLWWNPAESGWGINITVKNGRFFGAWFVYDAAGRAAWLTFQGGAWITQRCYQGQIIRTTGSALGGILALGEINLGVVGSGMVCFNDDGTTARFTYTVDGIASEKIIYRQPF